jgi:competence CoiA-like predicted nuclease
MLYAIFNKEKTLPTKTIEAVCPFCNLPVIAKMGDKKIHHWAHKTLSPNCLAYEYDKYKPMSEWHRNWQLQFDKDKVEVRHYKWTNNIADICLGNPDTDDYLVIELQHSNIPYKKIIERIENYKNVYFVIDKSKENKYTLTSFKEVNEWNLIKDYGDTLQFLDFTFNKKRIEETTGYAKFFKNLKKIALHLMENKNQLNDEARANIAEYKGRDILLDVPYKLKNEVSKIKGVKWNPLIKRWIFRQNMDSGKLRTPPMDIYPYINTIKEARFLSRGISEDLCRYYSKEYDKYRSDFYFDSFVWLYGCEDIDEYQS